MGGGGGGGGAELYDNKCTLASPRSYTIIGIQSFHPIPCGSRARWMTATFDPTMRFKRSNSNLENFHDVFGVAAFSLLLIPWRDIS